MDKPLLEQSYEPHLYELDKDFDNLDHCTKLVINYLICNKFPIKNLRLAIKECLPAIRMSLENSKENILTDEELSIIYECSVVDFIHLQLAKRGKIWSTNQIKSLWDKSKTSPKTT